MAHVKARQRLTELKGRRQETVEARFEWPEFGIAIMGSVSNLRAAKHAEFRWRGEDLMKY